jgi:hypothetical protein
VSIQARLFAVNSPLEATLLKAEKKLVPSNLGDAVTAEQCRFFLQVGVHNGQFTIVDILQRQDGRIVLDDDDGKDTKIGWSRS